VMIHMASVWVPFTSESKEAIADYDEIRKEMRLALQECGRKLQTYLNRRRKMARQGERRSAFLRYIGEIAKSCGELTGRDPTAVHEALLQQAERKTAEVDLVLDDEGRIVDDGGSLARDEGVVIVESRQGRLEGDEANDDLFGENPPAGPTRRRASGTTSKTRRKVRRGGAR
jgi:DNA topoisomerase-6 subunit B